jgi:beta-mannosidase
VLKSVKPVFSHVPGTLSRGGPALYRADLEVRSAGEAQLASSTTFGIRTIELRRTSTETRFLLNGKPIYLRGATYWPDVYLSAIDRARYEHYRIQKYDPNAGYFLCRWLAGY